MLIPFRKMQAQGNDFVILVMTEQSESKFPLEELARDICDRRKGVGADGLVLLLAHPDSDARMLIHNSDGSRAAMCGSALRCCAFLLNRIKGKTELQIATDSGIKAARIIEDLSGKSVEVNLGHPVLVEKGLSVEEIQGDLVEVGNFHFVSFWERLDGQEHRLGPVLEKHPRFAQAVNSEFVKVLSRAEIDLRVWETGCGATLACGTGAVAGVFSGIRQGLLDPQVQVNMPGGAVVVQRWENGEFILVGGVEHVFSGVYGWKT